MTADEAQALVAEAFAWLTSLTPDEHERFADDITTLIAATDAHILRAAPQYRGKPMPAVAVVLTSFKWGAAVAMEYERQAPTIIHFETES